MIPTTAARCLTALALLCGIPGAQAEALQTQLSAGLGAQAPDFDRSVFEVGYKQAPGRNGYRFQSNLRFGRYDPADAFGDELAESDGFTAGARPLYAAVYFGFQGPVPLIRSNSIYGRASVGLTSYLGQIGTRGTDTALPVRGIDPRFAPGMELAFGVGEPTGPLRFWSEVRLGGEYITGTGFELVEPVIAVGIDLSP